MLGVDLFSGAGGMSLGAQMSGIDVAVAIESDKYACATYAANHKNTTLLNEDIRSVRSIKLPSRRKPLILFGGPPCQGFSTSNQRTRHAANSGNWLFKEYVRLVKVLKPDWLVFENVRGILETEGGLFLECILSSFQKAGYSLSWGIINAKDFSVPQNRSRLFIVGSRHGLTVALPAPLTSTPITVADAIEDLPDLPNGASDCKLPYRREPRSEYCRLMRGQARDVRNNLVTQNASHIIKRYKFIPQGGNWENIPSRLMKNYSDVTGCHTRIYYRLKEDEPAVVIGNYRKNMLIHPCQDRGLSVREAARLQSFPDSFYFTGSIGFQQQQVGNAVPPLLAKAVFDSIMKQVDSGRKY